MGINTLSQVGTSPVLAVGTQIDQYFNAITQDIVPRNASGVATTSGGDIGTSSYKFKDLWLAGNGYIAGNVGIGTTFAGYESLLTVGTGSGSQAITVYSGTASNGSIFFADGTVTDSRYRGIIEYDHANDRMEFGTAAATRMTINSDGLGIGTTSTQGLLTLYTAVDGTSVASNEMLTLWNNNSWGSTGINSIKWRDNNTGSGTVNGAIGLTYNAPTVDFVIHSLYNSGYKTESDISFIVKGNGKVGVGGQPSYLLDANKSSSGSTIYTTIRNTSNTAGSSAGLFIQVAGTSAGDPLVLWSISGGITWYGGADNDDSDSWKLSTSATLSSPAITVTTAGAVTIPTVNSTTAGLTTANITTANITTLDVEYDASNYGRFTTNSGGAMTIACSGLSASVEIDSDTAIDAQFRLKSADLQISSGSVTITKGHHRLSVETGSADDLDNILGGSSIGKILVLQKDNYPTTITIKNGTGNIVLSGSDFAMDSSDDVIVLCHNGSNWCEMSRSNNA